MKTKLYVWWVKLQANHMPWTKLYKYRVREWERMQDTQNYLKSYWADGHKGTLNAKELEKQHEAIMLKLEDRP